MKIDSKSLVFGILVGIAVGSITSLVFVRYLPSGFRATEKYTVTMRVSGFSSIYPSGTAIVVFLRNNATIGEYQVWISPATNATLEKGDYTVKIYKPDSGIFVKAFQIYIAKDIEIDL